MSLSTLVQEQVNSSTSKSCELNDYYKRVSDNYREEIQRVIAEFGPVPQEFKFSDFIEYFTRCFEFNETLRGNIEEGLDG